VLLMALITALVGWHDTHFLSAENWRDIIVRCAPTAIVACGLMLIVVTGEIDISVGSLMAFLAAVMGWMLSHDHANWPLWIAVPLVLVAGTLVGGVTGLLVTVGRVPSIIVTLGLLTMLRGATTWMMGGENIDGLPSSLERMCKEGWYGLPLSVWVAIAVVLFTAVWLEATPWGPRLFALGSSRHAATTMGLAERPLKCFAFAYTGLMTAIATLVEVPRLPKIEAGIGTEFELLVVTCVVVGGVSIAGGQGRLGGVVLAVCLMTMIRPVLTFLDVGEAAEKWTKAIQGLFILMAVTSERLLHPLIGRTRP
jgi:ribose/xylose/arabinose/galactoside ABC-type transport system permease subunit